MHISKGGGASYATNQLYTLQVSLTLGLAVVLGLLFLIRDAIQMWD